MSQPREHAFLQAPEVQAFIARSRRRRVPARHTILHHGDRPESLYLILEGSVSITVEDNEGREMVLAYRYPGEFFGEMCLFPALETRSAVVTSRAETWLAEMNYASFRSFYEETPGIMLIIAEQLAMGLRNTSRRLANLTFLDVTGRIAHILLDLAKAPEAVEETEGTMIRLSRQELARIAGCSREMAGRVLKNLEEDGLIRSNGRQILVLNPAS